MHFNIYINTKFFHLVQFTLRGFEDDKPISLYSARRLHVWEYTGGNILVCINICEGVSLWLVDELKMSKHSVDWGEFD